MGGARRSVGVGHYPFQRHKSEVIEDSERATRGGSIPNTKQIELCVRSYISKMAVQIRRSGMRTERDLWRLKFREFNCITRSATP